MTEPDTAATADDVDEAARDAAELLVAVEDPDAALTAALARAQGKFPTIPKGSTATVTPSSGKPGYTYKYAELGDVLAAVRPVLSEEGLALTQPTVREAGKLILRTTLRHTGGGELVSELELGANPNSPQAFGGSLTYLRRYEACTLLGIAPEDDRDAQDVEPPRASSPPAAAPERPAWATPADTGGVRRRLAGLVGDEATGELLEAIGNYCGGAVPRVAARALLGLVTRLEDAELIPRVEPAADAQRAAQDAAAEAPDTPAPDDTSDSSASNEEAKSEHPPAEGPSRATAAALAAATNDELDDMRRTHPDLGVQEAAAAELNRRKMDAARSSAPPEREPAGTVDPPDPLPQDPAKAAGAMRAAGCTCSDPLKQGGDDDSCPIRGHGIPF